MLDLASSDGKCEEDDAVFLTVKAYRDLARNCANRLALVKDSTCLHFLVFTLGESNTECIMAALETLWYLSETKQYRTILKQTYYLLQTLENMKTGNGKIRYPEAAIKLSEDIHSRLREHREPLRDTSNCLSPITRHTTTGMGSNKQRVIGDPSIAGRGMYSTAVDYNRPFLSQNRKAKTVVIQLGVDMAMQACESSDPLLLPWCECKRITNQVLLSVPGVISVTHQSHKRRCLVRIKRDGLAGPKMLVNKLNDANDLLGAVHVVKDNSSGKEMVMRYDDDAERSDEPPVSSLGLQHVPAPLRKLPSYLAEEDSIRQHHGYTINTRPSPREQKKGWLTAAANFLHQTFYW